jgi:hypothetical protein
MALISSSKFGKCSSARLRPRAAKLSSKQVQLSSSRVPLQIVRRFHPRCSVHRHVAVSFI